MTQSCILKCIQTPSCQRRRMREGPAVTWALSLSKECELFLLGQSCLMMSNQEIRSHFLCRLLQGPADYWKWKSQSCLTLCDPTDFSLPGSCIHWILQAVILEWLAIPFSRGPSRPLVWRDRTQVSCIAGRLFTIWATREAHSVLNYILSPSSSIFRLWLS